MKAKKPLDCVAMKRKLQDGLLKQWKGLTPAQVRARIEHGLATSDSDLAKWWRKATQKNKKTVSAR